MQAALIAAFDRAVNASEGVHSALTLLKGFKLTDNIRDAATAALDDYRELNETLMQTMEDKELPKPTLDLIRRGVISATRSQQDAAASKLALKAKGAAAFAGMASPTSYKSASAASSPATPGTKGKYPELQMDVETVSEADSDSDSSSDSSSSSSSDSSSDSSDSSSAGAGKKRKGHSKEKKTSKKKKAEKKELKKKQQKKADKKEKKKKEKKDKKVRQTSISSVNGSDSGVASPSFSAGLPKISKDELTTICQNAFIADKVFGHDDNVKIKTQLWQEHGIRCKNANKWMAEFNEFGSSKSWETFCENIHKKKRRTLTVSIDGKLAVDLEEVMLDLKCIPLSYGRRMISLGLDNPVEVPFWTSLRDRLLDAEGKLSE